MSQAAFVDLEARKADIDHAVGSGSQAEQTARIMVDFEKGRLSDKRDLAIAVGGVYSTSACATTPKTLGMAVAHVDAAQRSWDMVISEEINRLRAYLPCEYLLAPDHFANDDLLAEGVPRQGSSSWAT